MDKRSRVIECAKLQIDIKESPAGSNNVKFNKWYGHGAIEGKWAWCGTFISYVFHFADVPLGEVDTPEGFHYVPSAQNYYRKHKQVTRTPQKADIVIFDFNGGLPDHCGIFYKWVSDTKFLSYEGNTSPDEKGSQSNGGRVCLKLRDIKNVTSFISPNVLK